MEILRNAIFANNVDKVLVPLSDPGLRRGKIGFARLNTATL